MNRYSGVLMHISSLPGEYSVGSFGEEAKRFVDFLAEGGFSIWQVLPFCMTDEYNSPYKSFSSFGGNPYFIDLPTLAKEGLITEEELTNAKQKSPYLCEYSRLQIERLPLLFRAASRVRAREEVIEFIKKYPQLQNTAVFMALREANAQKPWQEWTVDNYDEDTLFAWQFIQYKFFSQWMDIKEYANSKGISIVGDIPIYVAADSADVWSDPTQFMLDERNNPSRVSGVPPDYFSEDGQMWGNPLYNWEKMKENGYSWWCERIAYMLTLFDGVRIDHFRGLEAFWSIPAEAESTKQGEWVSGPGKALIDKIKSVAGEKLIIAEDLGDITPEVYELLEYSGFPGMRVFQFAFLGDLETVHLPHNYTSNCVAYTGTHDNNTLLGYVWELDRATRDKVLEYCGGYVDDWNVGCMNIIRTMLASHAQRIIFPIQDIFVYGADTRMNTPGTAKNNWAYRITKEQLEKVNIRRFYELNHLFGRI